MSSDLNDKKEATIERMDIQKSSAKAFRGSTGVGGWGGGGSLRKRRPV